MGKGSKHLKGQLEPSVRQVTFFGPKSQLGPKGQLDRRSVGAPHSTPPTRRAPQARGEKSRVSASRPCRPKAGKGLVITNDDNDCCRDNFDQKFGNFDDNDNKK